MNHRPLTLLLGSLFVGGLSAFNVLALTPADEKAGLADKTAAEKYDADGPEAEDPLAGELPAGTRVAREAAELAQVAGGEAGQKIQSLLMALYEAGNSDDDRLAAATELRDLIPELGGGDGSAEAIQRQLTRRVDLAETAIRAMKDNSADDATRQLVNEMLIRAGIDYEVGNRSAHAAIARQNYRALRQTAPDVFAQIDTIFSRYYFNYNLHFVLSEPMMSRLLSDYRTETGGVADCILGAWVTGCQVTDTMVRADIRPSQNTAAFDLLVDGHTRTNTQGVKSPATIYTRGNHAFTIRKPTYFDGQQLTSKNATINININNRTTGISTKYDKIPILAGIARKIASKEVQRKQPQADAIAARKLANRALPRFEEEVADKYAEANGNIQNDLMQNLRSRNIEPSAYCARSTETHLAVSSRTITAESLAAPRPPTTPAPRRGLAVQMHQSAVNAAIDSLGISGRMTPTQLVERIEEALSELMNQDVVIDKSNIDNNTIFDFSSSDPLRVRFMENQVILIFRTGFIQEAKNRTVPRHVFEIPVGIEFNNGILELISPGTDTESVIAMKSTPIDPVSRLERFSARVVLKELLEKAFTEPRIERDTELDLEMADGSPLTLQMTQFYLTDGWMTAIMQ
ncbi:MAG: hypothetical protein RIK87_02970 [Fuerstiella sp.]